MIIIAVAILIITSPPEPAPPESDPIFDTYKNFITPSDFKVLNFTKSITNITYDNISVIQNHLSTFNQTQNLSYPFETIKNKAGSIDSLHFLEMSILYPLNPYLLLIDVTTPSGTTINHTALLFFHDNTVMISDFSLPTEKIDFLCNFTAPHDLLYNIILYTEISSYEVKCALSLEKEYVFRSNLEFTAWLTETLKNRRGI